jgi:RyR domain
MKPETYTPRPIDTSGVDLPQELTSLAEHLAENAHEMWAAERIAQGWTFGPARDDAARHHPCLIPYPALPENEKTFDRITAMGTLRAILKLGYRVLPPGGAQ